tara:strand:- start:1093 stop:3207 length:2115 start_codon:yes stop_codon:yes gene_type:complete
MSPRFGVPIIVALLLASSWAFSNEDVIDDWVRENQVSIESPDSPLLGIQDHERWLVLIADFPSHPSSDSWGPEQAQNMLDDIAQSYVAQLTGNTTQLTVIVSADVTTANEEVERYGLDTNSNRDSAADGTFLPMNLAEEVISDHASNVNWSDFDLNQDGEVDRLLILHTTKGQEESPGQSSKIWSHFTRLESPIKVDSGLTVGHYTMASLRTGSSGMGTVLHEMLHQMGALDLYPVHDSSQETNWHGVGNWDIMASGNWNGGGVWPALGTAATLDLIGAQRSTTMDLTWPATSVAPCIGPTVQMVGMSEGGKALKIPMNEEQVVWIERHTDSGFDKNLPGHGILVTLQDRSVGDEARNELNRDPDQPWLSVVEADGRNDMGNGINDGEASDVFTNGSKFGAEGIAIRNHDGFKVPWTATVVGDENITIQFTAPNCTSSFEANGPDFGAVLLPEESFSLSITTAQPCLLNHNLTLTDGRTITLHPATVEAGETDVELRFGWNGTPNSEVVLEGILTCGSGSLDLSTRLLTLARIPHVSTTIGTMPWTDSGMISIPIESRGNGTQSFTLDLDGPMARVGTVEDRIILDGNDELRITIDPNGLLQEGMKVRGELVLIDGNGHRWTYDLDFIAQDKETSTLDAWRTPGRLLSAVCLVGAVWVLLGFLERKKKPAQTPQMTGEAIPSQPAVEAFTGDTDPWGRPVDEHP